MQYICMMSALKKYLWPLLIFLLYQPVLAQDKTTVIVSIPPQKYFVQQIGGEKVDVRVMVLPGANPAVYEPKPKQMAAVSGAKLYFSIGVPFERAWLTKIAAMNPDLVLVPTDRDIKGIPMTDDHFSSGDAKDKTVVHRHDHHGGMDPHIWLSPPLVKLQARTIFEALAKIDPEYAGTYKMNYEKFILDLDSLDARIRTLFSGKKHRRFIVFHPSWGYFADHYGLEQISVEIEGKSPKPAQLGELIAYAKANEIRAVFVQPQFSTRGAETIAKAIHGRVIVADPLAGDWAGNLLNVAIKFSKGIN